MAHQRLAALLVALITSFGLLVATPAYAGLPQGNAVKDPAAILRDALPFEQEELRDLQHRLEATSDDLRAKRWSALSRSISKTQGLLSTRQSSILASMPANATTTAEGLLEAVGEGITAMQAEVDAQNKAQFIQVRRETLARIGDLEALVTEASIPPIPSGIRRPALDSNGRATVTISTTQGELTAVVDGYNAPLTAGASSTSASKASTTVCPSSAPRTSTSSRPAILKARKSVTSTPAPSSSGESLWKSGFPTRTTPSTTRPLKTSVCSKPHQCFPSPPWARWAGPIPTKTPAMAHLSSSCFSTRLN